MDQVDKMKLTKYGFGLNLLASSFFLSVLGNIVSSIGVIGSIICFVMAIDHRAFIGLGAVLLILMIPYIDMWVKLKFKTSKQDIPGIEKIGKVYSFVSGSLEIAQVIAQIIIHANNKHNNARLYIVSDTFFIFIFVLIPLVMACLKIHGVRVENYKLIGIYLGFRYCLVALFMIGPFIMCIIQEGLLQGVFAAIAAIAFIAYIAFIDIIIIILDIGLIVILHSIRVDSEDTARTENPMGPHEELMIRLGLGFIL